MDLDDNIYIRLYKMYRLMAFTLLQSLEEPLGADRFRLQAAGRRAEAAATPIGGSDRLFHSDLLLESLEIIENPPLEAHKMASWRPFRGFWMPSMC